MCRGCGTLKIQTELLTLNIIHSLKNFCNSAKSLMLLRFFICSHVSFPFSRLYVSSLVFSKGYRTSIKLIFELSTSMSTSTIPPTKRKWCPQIAVAIFIMAYNLLGDQRRNKCFEPAGRCGSIKYISIQECRYCACG